jgi:hypothetical protein
MQNIDQDVNTLIVPSPKGVNNNPNNKKRKTERLIATIENVYEDGTIDVVDVSEKIITLLQQESIKEDAGRVLKSIEGWDTTLTRLFERLNYCVGEIEGLVGVRSYEVPKIMATRGIPPQPK